VAPRRNAVKVKAFRETVRNAVKAFRETVRNAVKAFRETGSRDRFRPALTGRCTAVTWREPASRR
jgi:hypothetical protein